MNAVRYNTVEYLKYFNNLNTYRDVSNMFSNIFPYLANNEISLVNADGTYKSHDIVMEEILRKILKPMDAQTITIMQSQIESILSRLSDMILGIHEYIKSSRNISTFSVYYEQEYRNKPDITIDKPINELSKEELSQLQLQMKNFKQIPQYITKKSILTFGNSESDLGEYTEVKEIPLSIKNYLAGNISVNPVVLTQYYMLAELFFIFTHEIPQDTETELKYTVQDIFVSLLQGAEQFILEYTNFGEYVELGDIIRYTGNGMYIVDNEFLPFILNRVNLPDNIKEVISEAIQTSNNSLEEIKKFHRIDIERFNSIDYDMFTLPFAEHQILFNRTATFFTELNDYFKGYFRTKSSFDMKIQMYKDIFDTNIMEQLKEKPLSEEEKEVMLQTLNTFKTTYQQILDTKPSEYTPLEIVENVSYADISHEREQVIPKNLEELGFVKPYIEYRIDKKFLPRYNTEYFNVLLDEEYHDGFVSIFKDVFKYYTEDINDSNSLNIIDEIINKIQ